MLRCLLPAALLLALVAAQPAGSVLIDDESSNDLISTATTQIGPGAAVTTDGGLFTLVPGDTDYIGISNLVPGDIVTVSTTPLDDALFEDPDTFIGLFASGGSKVCENDDTLNNLLANPVSAGLGSLCRFVIDSAGTFFVGVSGFSDPPFTGNHFADGEYQLVVTINAVPEPGAMLQLVSGGAGLAWLQRRRNRKLRAGRSPKERDRDRWGVTDA
jgi:hypothetical protein